MKGNKKLIEVLNSLLSDELTAINQYMVHSEMCANWGFDRLHESIEKRAIEVPEKRCALRAPSAATTVSPLGDQSGCDA